MKSFSRLWKDRSGNVLAITAAALPLVIGSAGLASDTIQWALWKRQLQRAADSAAIAGVYARFQGQAVNSAVNTDLGKNHHTGIALLASYPQISQPAATSQWNNAVKVDLAVQKPLSFSSIFMAQAPIITVSATAAAIETGQYCVVSLENTSVTGISIGGNANVNLGCGMITNSTSLDAAVAFGSSQVVASPIAAVGGLDPNDNWGPNTQLLPFTLAQEDPFANVHPPSTFPSSQCPQLNVNPNTVVNRSSDTGTICFRDMDLNGTVVLGPATYVIDGGDLSISSQANVSCNGCTFVLTSRTAATNPSSIGSVTINGGAQLNLIAPSTGTYAGIIMYQDRRAPLGNNQNRINGNSLSSFRGAFYFPGQETIFNGTAGMQTACVQLVARRVTFTGTAAITNTCPAGSGASSFTGRHVRLVA